MGLGFRVVGLKVLFRVVGGFDVRGFRIVFEIVF